MHCYRHITEDLVWVGANDRRLAMFEGVYSVPAGVSYNSYLLMDEKTVVFDTVDKAVRDRFMENVKEALGGRKLDYLIVQHMEPDHSAGICELAAKFPEMIIVCNAKTLAFLKQFHDFEIDIDARVLVVKEGDTLATGRHVLHFVMAPMVHWPEVMVTYDAIDKILFSADAFGCFGALNGAIFADEVDFSRDYMDEARRYYTNIVGKYGSQVKMLLGKASGLDIQMICPLHGFVWRRGFDELIAKYVKWSSYEPEETGVMIAYASVYGNTENAAEILACRLREKGIKVVMFDVSVTPASEIVSAAFRWSHHVFASTTYNAGIFVTMEALLHDLVSHNIQNRTVAIIENGSWAATSGGLIRQALEKCPKMNILDNILTIKSGLKRPQLADLAAMADAIAATMPQQTTREDVVPAEVDPNALFKLSYGLYVLTAHENGQDNGCIINTAAQLTVSPLYVSVTIHKDNHTCGMIERTGKFNVSVLDESTDFEVFKRFGFASGKDTDKFADHGPIARTANGLSHLTENANAVLSVKVTNSHDYGTHMLFVGELVQSCILSETLSMTYQYYFDHVKPKPQAALEHKGGFICKICAYVYEGDSLPADYICPLCKHGAADFEKL